MFTRILPNIVLGLYYDYTRILLGVYEEASTTLLEFCWLASAGVSEGRLLDILGVVGHRLHSKRKSDTATESKL